MDGNFGSHRVISIQAMILPSFARHAIFSLASDPGIAAPNVDKLYTPNQQIMYPDIRSGSAIPVGVNAANAGFTTDMPMIRPLTIVDVIVTGRGMH
jgi:hypothetical protein